MEMACKHMLWDLIKVLKTNQIRFMQHTEKVWPGQVCDLCEQLGDACILSHRQTHKLQHIQSCIRLYGETNPVTVSGNVSAPARCNLDSAEGESPRLQNQCFLVCSLFFCLPLFFYFIYKWHTVLVTGLPYQWLTRAPPPNPPWPPEQVP